MPPGRLSARGKMHLKPKEHLNIRAEFYVILRLSLLVMQPRRRLMTADKSPARSIPAIRRQPHSGTQPDMPICSPGWAEWIHSPPRSSGRGWWQEWPPPPPPKATPSCILRESPPILDCPRARYGVQPTG